MITQLERDTIVIDWIKTIHHDYEESLQDESYSKHSERFLSDLNNAMTVDDVTEAVDRVCSARHYHHSKQDLAAIRACQHLEKWYS